MVRRSLVCFAVLLAVAGCGGSGDGRPVTVVAGEATAAARTVRIAGSSQQLGAEAPDTEPEMTGVVDLARHRLRLEHGATRSGEATVLCTPTPCAAPDLPAATLDATPASTVLLVGADTWEKDDGPGGLAGDFGAPPGRWLHLRRGDPSAAAATTSYYDPQRWLALLRRSDHVERLDRAEVRGVPTTHYRFTVRPRATTTTHPDLRQQYRYEAWISNDHLVRRLRMTVRFETSSDGRSTSTDDSAFTIEFFDFGVAADIEPPSAADVVEMPACGTILASGSRLSCGSGAP